MRSIEMSTASSCPQEPTLYQSRQNFEVGENEKLLSYTFTAPDRIAPGVDLDEE